MVQLTLSLVAGMLAASVVAHESNIVVHGYLDTDIYQSSRLEALHKRSSLPTSTSRKISTTLSKAVSSSSSRKSTTTSHPATTSARSSSKPASVVIKAVSSSIKSSTKSSSSSKPTTSALKSTTSVVKALSSSSTSTKSTSLSTSARSTSSAKSTSSTKSTSSAKSTSSSKSTSSTSAIITSSTSRSASTTLATSLSVSAISSSVSAISSSVSAISSSVSAISSSVSAISSSVSAISSSVSAITSSTSATSSAKSATSSSTTMTSSSTSASATPTSTGGPRAVNATSKRGIPYNDVALTAPFLSSPNVNWVYNWYSAESSADIHKNYEFIPMLWNNGSQLTSVWDANVKASLAAGSKHLLSFNEPDHPEQANMDPASAARGYMKWMQPYAGVAKLGSPGITNGGGTWGVNWLKSFMSNCTNCTIDFTPCHWYDSATNFGYFQWQLEQVYNVTGKPVWVTEFGASGTDEQISAFFQQALPWMDSQPWIERYSYFMAADGILVNKTMNMLTDYGTVYAHL